MAPNQSERRLEAIELADITSYTVLMKESEEESKSRPRASRAHWR